MQLVRDEWQVAVSKIGHLEVGESVVFTHGPGTVEALQPDGGITVKASFGKSFTFESDCKVFTLISSISVPINKSPPAWLAFDRERRLGDLTANIECHIDFTENFDIEEARQVQSEHWSTTQCSLFMQV